MPNVPLVFHIYFLQFKKLQTQALRTTSIYDDLVMGILTGSAHVSAEAWLQESERIVAVVCLTRAMVRLSPTSLA